MSKSRRRKKFSSKKLSSQPHNRRGRSLCVEQLEDRRLLAVFTVSSLSDAGAGSLREAITMANGNGGADTINFSVNGTIDLVSQLPTITDDLTITGPGANLLTIDAGDGTDNTFNTGDGFRIFNIDDGIGTQLDVTLSGLTLTGGDVSDMGGAILNRENLAVTSSTISGNSTGSAGGGIDNSFGTLTITGSTISGNSANYGGGISNGGTATVTSSTISGNTAGSNGGGISGLGGSLTIDNSTLSGNLATNNGGGIFSVEETLNVTSSTLSGNTAYSGGGLYSQSNAYIDSSIVANSPSGGDITNYGFLSGANNLVEDGSGGLTAIITGDPLLGPLADNGGPTLTHALLPSSPAIDAGQSSELFDQRGTGFGRNVLGGVDIGAFEGQSQGPVFTSLSNVSLVENTTAVQTLMAISNPPGQGITFSIAGTGADDSQFEVIGSELKFITAPDYANPTDLGGVAGDNVYEVSVIADDGNGGTTPQSITVTVIPVNDNAPVLGPIGDQVIDEQTELTFTATATDADLPANGLTFSLDPNAPSSASIDPTTGMFSWTPTEADGPGTFDISVLVTDDGSPALDDFEVITITVNEVNTAPTITSSNTANVAENTLLVHTLTADDADLPTQTVTFTIDGSGEDNALFKIVSGGLRFDPTPDFENPSDTNSDNVYEVSVLADDGAGGTVPQTVLVTVTDVVVESPQTYVVNIATDENDGNFATDDLSLREAIALANADVSTADTITFDASLAGSTLLLTLGQLDISAALTITGLGQDLLTIDANLQSRIFNITATTGDFTLAGLTLTGGRTTGDNLSDTTFSGGAVRSLTTGNLSIDQSTIDGNSTTGNSTGGGGVFSTGDVTLTSSTVSGNDSTLGGGGIFTSSVSTSAVSLTNSTVSGNSVVGLVSSGRGGGIFASGAVTLTSSTVSGNSTASGIGGGIFSSGLATLTSSTVSGNISFSSGGGIFSFGGVTLDQSTVSENSTTSLVIGSGGGIRSSGVTLTNSTVSGNSTAGKGGGISSGSGGVTLTSSTVSGNSTAGSSSAEGGGIYSIGAVTLTNSTVSGNSTEDLFAEGGGISSGTVTLTSSTVSGNSTTGLRAGGGGINARFVTLTSSTVSGNSTGGLYAVGGGINTRFVTLTSSTVSGNSTGSTTGGGGIFSIFGAVTLTSSTVSDNHASNSNATGGGIWNQSDTITITNSIAAGNTAGGGSPDINPGTGTFSVNYSLIGTGVTPDAGGSGNLFNNAPLLGPLADNGGPTKTHALMPNSPAVNAGSSSELFDQRGLGFNRNEFGAVDIGAFERQNELPVFTSPNTANVAENTTVVHTLTATDVDLPAQTILFSITGSGKDNAKFEIIGGNQVQFIIAPDFDNPTDLGEPAGDNVYEISVQADDGNGGTAAQTILVTVTQVVDPDFDQNGIIDAGDLVIWQSGFGSLNAGPADGDADNDNDVDGADFLAWQLGFGTSSLSATQADGDANNDTTVDASDLTVWQGQFGQTVSSLVAASTAPLP